jgi:hypothetical protein
VYKTITIITANVKDIEEVMIDYAEKLLDIARNYKAISKLLITEDKESTIDEINSLIINAIDLKQWVINHNETN